MLMTNFPSISKCLFVLFPWNIRNRELEKFISCRRICSFSKRSITVPTELRLHPNTWVRGCNFRYGDPGMSFFFLQLPRSTVHKITYPESTPHINDPGRSRLMVGNGRWWACLLGDVLQWEVGAGKYIPRWIRRRTSLCGGWRWWVRIHNNGDHDW